MIRRIATIIGGMLLVIALTFWLLNSRLINESLAPFIYALGLTLISLINSLPQLLVWLIFMLIIAQFLLVGLFRFYTSFATKRFSPTPELAEPPAGPVEKYARWISRSGTGGYFYWRIAQRIMDATMDATGRREGRNVALFERSIVNEESDLPPEITTIMRNGIRARDGAFKNEAVTRLKTLMGGERHEHDDLINAVSYLENYLGIRNQFADDLPAEEAAEDIQVNVSSER